MRNKKHHAHTGGSVTLALPVAAGTKSGDIVTIGAAGLFGVATTDRVTADMVTTGKHPQGYVEGQAGVYLPGITLTLSVPATALTTFADGAKVYRSAAGAFTAANTDTFVGYRLNATTLALRSN